MPETAGAGCNVQATTADVQTVVACSICEALLHVWEVRAHEKSCRSIKRNWVGLVLDMPAQIIERYLAQRERTLEAPYEAPYDWATEDGNV